MLTQGQRWPPLGMAGTPHIVFHNMFTQPALHLLIWPTSHHWHLRGNYLTISNLLQVDQAMCQQGFYLELDQINNIHHHIKDDFL